MSHDIQAAWAATELVRTIREHPEDCVSNPPAPGTISAYASRESKRSWPFADGVININTGGQNYSVAMEFKRVEEGAHGILTALGQTIAYLHKGHNSAIVVIPRAYTYNDDPGDYLRQVLDQPAQSLPIGVFTYEEPDANKVSPFEDKITCARKFVLAATTTAPVSVQRTETQWAHIREGSSTPDAFYKYLLTVRTTTNTTQEPTVQFPQDLVSAVGRLSPGSDMLKYLSNTVGNTFHDMVWRHFWYQYVFHVTAMQIWSGTGLPYTVNHEPTKILQADGATYAEFWSAKSDSIKNRIVNELNNNAINTNQAWEHFAQNVRNRAHSFREDIDSGLEHLGLLDSDGRATELGHRFVDMCQRVGNPSSAPPMAILRASLIQNGQYGALLHYIHRLSDDIFSDNSMAFSTLSTSQRGARLTFKQSDYLLWLADKLANQLRVMRTVTSRGGIARGTERKPLQAELTMLGQLGLIPPARKRFRSGIGLVVEWPSVQEAVLYPV
ncbi:hypothetical protein ACFLV4_02570 [Chloroflexota bacterium]